LEIKQEVVVQGQDKVFKDVIEPLESVSVNLIPTVKQDIRELGSPQEVSSQFLSFSYKINIHFF
jgi:photosystem II oxygen-evolving enhancer protein 2